MGRADTQDTFFPCALLFSAIIGTSCTYYDTVSLERDISGVRVGYVVYIHSAPLSFFAFLHFWNARSWELP